MSLLTDIQPSTEPVTVDEVKNILRLDSSADDALILQHITSAREYCEKATRRSLVYKGYRVYFDSFPTPGKPMRVPMPPLISVTGIFYLDTALVEQEWDAAEYFVANKQEPGLVIARPGFVYPVAGHVPDSVWITFRAGYSAEGYGDDSRPCPEHLRLAIMQLAAHFYDNPEAITSNAVNQVPNNLMDLLRANQIYVF